MKYIKKLIYYKIIMFANLFLNLKKSFREFFLYKHKILLIE